MLQKLREWLVLLLIVVLPFHAFLVTVGTRLLVGPGHAPLLWLVGWKEMVLGMVILVAIVEMLIEFKIQNSKFKIDILDCLILGLLVLSVVVPITYHLSPITYVYGFKYTLFPLLLFLVLRRVPWSQQFSIFNFQFSIFVGVIVVAYGILTLFLPASFFTWLGYSDLHSLYLPDGPIAAFQQIEGTGIRRIQSTFSGPNQLGMWLLIPWSMALGALVHKAPHPNPLPRGEGKIFLGFLALVGIALFLTFSRAAWIGAAVILLVSVWQIFSRKSFRAFSFQLSAFSLLFLVILLLVSTMLRPRSTVEHFRRPMEAIRMIAAHPLGFGLGSAGPAANHTSDPCVFLEEGADVSWAKDRQNLCVFSGDVQVQPAGHVCRCPFLPENWYLQVGVELGVIGLVLYLLLVGVTSYWLLVTRPWFSWSLAFVGISVAALFLHAWEDSAVAYTVWTLLAGALQPPCCSRHSSLS